MFALIGWIGRVLLILLVVRLVMSLFSGGTRRAAGSGTNAPGAGRGGRRPAVAGTRLVRDPQCGTYVAEPSAVRILHGGEMRYFCSDKCRDEFLAAARVHAT